MTVVDLFAGPGGWDLGAADLGIEPLGIELDDDACATRVAAGLPTVQADVAALDPAGYPAEGLIASPPCQAFSQAGAGAGRRDVAHVVAATHELAAGHDTRALHAGACEDPRSILVVEPLRWARAIRPQWIAFEQTPHVLGLWTLFAQVLSTWGYGTWAGVLSAEQFGLGQARRRAFLLAVQGERRVEPPAPTHHAYRPGEWSPPAREDLFGSVLAPWVTMAEALGWKAGEPMRAGAEAASEWAFRRPAPTVGTTFGGVAGKQTDGHVNLLLPEALALQGFPADYPLRGTVTKRFEQVGNAVPPPLARVVLGAVVA